MNKILIIIPIASKIALKVLQMNIILVADLWEDLYLQ